MDPLPEFSVPEWQPVQFEPVLFVLSIGGLAENCSIIIPKIAIEETILIRRSEIFIIRAFDRDNGNTYEKVELDGKKLSFEA